MSTPAAKRRRIDAANQALSKPFRSPFKKSPAKDTTSASQDIMTTESALSATNTVIPLSSKSANTLLIPKPFLATPKPRTKKTFSSPVAAAALNSDPEVATLLRAQRELEKELRAVKEELDTAEQARKIEADSRKKDPTGEIDGELIELMGKWKAASRMAAEELFGQVRDRVNRMGGPRAWKEMQKRQEEWQNSWNQEDEAGDGKDDDDEDEDEGGQKQDYEKRDLYAEYDIDPETENEKSQRAKGLGDTGELPGQEDEFTMAMMLRTLNVDLDIIGYDKQMQRWVD